MKGGGEKGHFSVAEQWKATIDEDLHR